MIRPGVATLSLALLAVVLVQGSGAKVDQRARGTALCPRPSGFRIEVGRWSEPTPGSQHEFFAAMWSRGGRGVGGVDVYAWATPTRSQLNPICRRNVQRGSSSSAALRAPLFYRANDSGNAFFVDSGGAVTPGSQLFQGRVDPVAQRHAYGLRFSCSVRQRIVVHVHPLAGQGGHYLSVRTERSRRLLALALLKRSGDSSIRIGTSCQPD